MKKSKIKKAHEKREKLLDEWHAKKRIKKKIGVKKGYKIWSKIYDSDAKGNPMILLEEEIVEKTLSSLKDKKVLDVGCGTGRWTLKLAKRGAKVTGIEPNPKMLKYAKRNAKKKKLKIDFKKANAYKLPFKNNEFDFIISGLVLSHIKDLHKTVKEMTRVLKPDGEIILTTRHPFIVRYQKQHSYDEGVMLTIGNLRYFIEAYYHSLQDFIEEFNKNKLQLTNLKEGLPNKSKHKKKLKKHFGRLWDDFQDLNFCIVFKLRKRKLK